MRPCVAGGDGAAAAAGTEGNAGLLLLLMAASLAADTAPLDVGHVHSGKAKMGISRVDTANFNNMTVRAVGLMAAAKLDCGGEVNNKVRERKESRIRHTCRKGMRGTQVRKRRRRGSRRKFRTITKNVPASW